MKNEKKKRIKHKKLFNKNRRVSIPFILAIVSTFLFCVTQLAINSNLNPLGSKLENLNNEKKKLIAENRAIEEEIAKAKSLKVITHLAEKKLNIKKNADFKIKFLSDNRVVANAN